MALTACSILYVVLFMLIPGGSEQTENFGSAFTQVREQVTKFSKDLVLMNQLSPAKVLGGMKKFDADSLKNLSDISPCTAALDVFLGALESGELWAIAMVDASSKLPGGLLSGKLVDLGTYDQCVDIIVADNSEASFTGQHCLVVLHLHFSTVPEVASPGVLAALGNSLAYTFALCLPSACSPATLEQSLAEVADDVNYYLASSANLTLQFSVDQSDCHVKQRPPLDTAEVVGIVVTLCSLVIVAISTVVDLTLSYQNESTGQQAELRRCLKVMTAFSLYTNGRRLVDTRVPEDSLSVLHAIKFLSIAWVAIGHRIKFSAENPLINLLELADYIKNWSSMLVLNATLSVDVFFLISGILNTYVYMNLARRGGTTLQSHLVGYVHRYLRLTPAYALMMLVTATWLYRTGDGPLWDRLVGDAKQDCTHYWWSGLLYINNYYNPNNNCMMQSWYLAADMQLFWLSPLLLYPLSRWPVFGVLNLLSLVVVSVIIPFLVAYVDLIKTPIPISFDKEKVSREMAELYFPTHTKTVSYIIGILTGYHLHLVRSKKITLKISWLTNVALWTVAVLSLAYAVFGGYYIFQLDSPYDQWESSLYIGIFRFFWSIGLAWIILACTTGYGGFVNNSLSVRIFAPLGRLTYAIYLTHVTVILYGIGSMRQPQHFSYYEMILKFLGEFVIATFLALILSLTVEAPIMVLEKLFRNDKRQPRKVVVSLSRRSSRPNHVSTDPSHEA